MFDEVAEGIDTFFVGIIFIAVVALLVGSGQTEQLIADAGGMLTKLIYIILPAGSGTDTKSEATPSSNFTSQGRNY